MSDTRFASLTNWTANQNEDWQITIQSPFIFGSIEGCQSFNNKLLRLEYRIEDQNFCAPMNMFGDPESIEDFQKRLPIFKLIDSKGREHEIDSQKTTLSKNLMPTSDLSLQDYIKKFKEDTVFNLISYGCLESKLIVKKSINLN